MSEVVSDVCARIAQAFYLSSGTMPGLPRGEMSSPGETSGPDGCADPIVLIPRAARGDIEAQRALAEGAILVALAGDPQTDPFVVLSEGLMFARMAASLGSPADAMRVIRMLSMANVLCTEGAAEQLAAEALARLELLADAGEGQSDWAAEQLATCAAREAPGTLELARQYRDRLRAS